MAAATPGPERLLAVIEIQNAIAAGGLSADEVMTIVVDRVRTLTGGSAALVGIVDGSDIAVRATAGGNVAIDSHLPASYGRCVAERRPLQTDDALVVPLLYGEAAVGVLAAVAPKFVDDDVELLRLLAQVIAIALHRAYTYPRPRLDNQHDALTNLGNRRAFDERVEAELARNRRYRHSFSLAILELDNLETACDRFGQAAADAALREIAGILGRHTRVIDACFRVAVDQFAIVMPGTSLEGARTLVERCRSHIDDLHLCDGIVTASFGVVEASDEAPDALVSRATAANTADKHARRPS
jgi:diguanylate cyclase (GGDEF)-like protein